MEPENASRIVDALREFGFDTPQLAPGLFLQDQRIVRMGNVPLRIETRIPQPWISRPRRTAWPGASATPRSQRPPAFPCTIRQARLDPSAPGHRPPPVGWEAVLARLTRERSQELSDLADRLDLNHTII
jgi:hypothetical protein